MNKLNLLVSFTDKNRRREERRSYYRRVIKHAFGTEKWVQAVRSSYAFWPKQDRRSLERRSLTRRMVERRTRLRKYNHHAALGQQKLRNYRQSQMLTEEERKMLNELSRRF
tara:strand:- start:37476 stop:37808 length:333 start_codon:yes stop_codon:yes gene_type:complete